MNYQCAVCRQFLERSYGLSDVFFPACTCHIQNIQHDLWHFWQTPLLGCHRLLQTRPGCNVYHCILHPNSAKLQIMWQNHSVCGNNVWFAIPTKWTNNKWYFRFHSRWYRFTKLDTVFSRSVSRVCSVLPLIIPAHAVRLFLSFTASDGRSYLG